MPVVPRYTIISERHANALRIVTQMVSRADFRDNASEENNEIISQALAVFGGSGLEFDVAEGLVLRLLPKVQEKFAEAVIASLFKQYPNQLDAFMDKMMPAFIQKFNESLNSSNEPIIFTDQGFLEDGEVILTDEEAEFANVIDDEPTIISQPITMEMLNDDDDPDLGSLSIKASEKRKMLNTAFSPSDMSDT